MRHEAEVQGGVTPPGASAASVSQGREIVGELESMPGARSWAGIGVPCPW